MIAATSEKLSPAAILYVGLDIHKETHAVVASDCFGTICLNKEIKNDNAGFNHLVQTVSKLARDHSLHPVYGLEDTGGNGRKLASFLFQSGHLVKSVNPVMVTRERSKSVHPEKSDPEDAKGVAKVLIHEGIDKLPTYSLSEKSRIGSSLKHLVNDRNYLVKERTRLKNHLHTLLYDKYGIDYQERSGAKDIFCGKAVKFFLAEITEGNGSDAGDIEQQILNNQIKRKLERLDQIRVEIKAIETEMHQLIELTDQKLETMPGCGLVTTATILSEIQDIARFSSASRLARYSGIAPREKSSGKKKTLLKSFSGNRKLQTAFHTVALFQISKYGSKAGKDYYQKKLAEGKTKMQSLAHLKRRIVDIVYLILKNETEYNYPEKPSKN